MHPESESNKRQKHISCVCQHHKSTRLDRQEDAIRYLLHTHFLLLLPILSFLIAYKYFYGFLLLFFVFTINPIFKSARNSHLIAVRDKSSSQYPRVVGKRTVAEKCCVQCTCGFVTYLVQASQIGSLYSYPTDRYVTLKPIHGSSVTSQFCQEYQCHHGHIRVRYL